MPVQHFWIRLTFTEDNLGAPTVGADEFLSAVENPLFETYGGSVTPSFRDGQAFLECDVEAPDVDTAVRRVARSILGIPLGTSGSRLRSLVVDGA